MNGLRLVLLSSTNLREQRSDISGAPSLRETEQRYSGFVVTTACNLDSVGPYR